MDTRTLKKVSGQLLGAGGLWLLECVALGESCPPSERSLGAPGAGEVSRAAQSCLTLFSPGRTRRGAAPLPTTALGTGGVVLQPGTTQEVLSPMMPGGRRPHGQKTLSPGHSHGFFKAGRPGMIGRIPSLDYYLLFLTYSPTVLQRRLHVTYVKYS